MKDKFGRNIDYLRISITDRCDLRCMYCMPGEGVMQTNHENILTYDEIVRLCHVFSDLGISKIKITGGEPLVRKNMPKLLFDLKQVTGITSVTITTNGVLLSKFLDELVKNGVDAINISLDTLDPAVYKQITGMDAFSLVLYSINTAALIEGLSVKINCVPLNVPSQKPEEVASLGKEREIAVRYIEMMPIGLGKQFQMVPQEVLKEKLERKYGKLQPFDGILGNGPAIYYKPKGFCGSIGFISALSHRFCSSCNRLRLTSEGFLKTCLQYETGVDLRTLLRKNGTDEDLKEAILFAVERKPFEHQFLEKETKNIEKQGMSRIGG